MKRAAYLAGALVAFCGTFVAFYYFGLRPGYDGRTNIFIVVTLPLMLFVVGIACLMKGVSDNIYNIKSGRVVRHEFTPEHMTPPTYIPGTPPTQFSPGSHGVMVPGHWVPSDWALEIEDDRGRRGLIHFAHDVFGDYPVGSYYSEPGA